MLLDLEGHGREEGLVVWRDVDLTRTVGWFTSLYPVRLDPGLLDLEEALSGGPALGRALKTIKEQLRAVPGKGLGYGLLRYLNDETAAELAGARRRSSASTIWAGSRPARTAPTGRRPTWMRAPTDARTMRAAWRRRSGDAAGASDRDQRADPGWGGRPAADGELDCGPARCSMRRRCAIWRRPGSGR